MRLHLGKRTGGTNQWLDADDRDKDGLPMLVLDGDIPQLPILITMSLDGTPVEFELDKGATVTVMSV